MTLIERWLNVRHLLLPSLELCGGTHDEDDIVAGLYAGRFSLWITDCASAALVSEICAFPRLRVLNCFLGGGNLTALVTLEDRITRFAKENGCGKLRIAGRKGWSRAFENAQPLAVIIQKEIENGP
jgi:hypothetical protein